MLKQLIIVLIMIEYDDMTCYVLAVCMEHSPYTRIYQIRSSQRQKNIQTGDYGDPVEGETNSHISPSHKLVSIYT